MIYRFGNITLDTESYGLERDGEVLAVEPQVFNLLQFLIENRTRVISKDEVIEQVWEGRIVSDAAITSAINLARRAVEDDGKTQAVIKTFPRRGFRFVAEILVDGDDENIRAVEPDPISKLDRLSIAVLPFENMSGDPEQEYFSDGMAEASNCCAF